MAARSAEFTATEKNILCNLVEKHKSSIENKRTDSVQCEAKKKAWLAVQSEFNCHRDVVRRDVRQLKRCWEKLKGEVKKRKTAEVRHRMGTGGGPPLRPFEDPITAQVERIVPHLDVVIDETLDSDYHHLATTSKSLPIPSSGHDVTPDPVNSKSTSTSQPIPSCSKFYSSTPVASSSTSYPLHNRSPSDSLPSPALSPSQSSHGTLSPSRLCFLPIPVTSTDQAPQPLLCRTTSSPAETSPGTRPSVKKRKPSSKANTSLGIAERELRARLEMMDEERKYIRRLYEMKIKRSLEKDKIIKERLRQAVAARKLTEAQLKEFCGERVP
ncbi:uncharacterized protein LOC124153736 [Ischnura elegans]|uniref:uncharacterized protein LOC124153736 n=1 Tax=Ischnura elegans TaxID=197161 RepID=UPI001ED8BD8E|nr:uncharacterized protein LOC124153736 [Ischnura elegans]